MSKSNRERSRAERAAAALAEQERAESRRKLLVGGGIVAAILLIVGVGVVIQSQRDTTGDDAAAPGNPTPTTSDSGSPSTGTGRLQVAPADDYGLGVGDPDAPVKVEVYEDFLCPVCKAFEGASKDDLRQAAQDGKVYLVYRPVAFLKRYGPYTDQALNTYAVVQDKAGAQAALKVHDLLYDEQPSESGPFPDQDWFVEKAVAAGAKEADVRPGIEDLTFEQWGENANDEASKAGATGTPYVLVDGEPFEPGEVTSWAAYADALMAAIEDGQ